DGDASRLAAVLRRDRITIEYPGGHGARSTETPIPAGIDLESRRLPARQMYTYRLFPTSAANGASLRRPPRGPGRIGLPRGRRGRPKRRVTKPSGVKTWRLTGTSTRPTRASMNCGQSWRA